MGAVAGEAAIAGAEREAAAAVDAVEVRIETGGLLDERVLRAEQVLLDRTGHILGDLRRLLCLCGRDRVRTGFLCGSEYRDDDDDACEDEQAADAHAAGGARGGPRCVSRGSAVSGASDTRAVTACRDRTLGALPDVVGAGTTFDRLWAASSKNCGERFEGCRGGPSLAPFGRRRLITTCASH